MATIHEVMPSFHSGERTIHRALRVSPGGNPTALGLTPGAAYLLMQSPLLAFGILDDQGRPWTAVWGGAPGFARPVSRGLVQLSVPVDARHDPVVDTLLHSDTQGRVASGLAIDLATRQRVKLFGAVATANLESDGATALMSLGVKINQSVGACYCDEGL